jgi:hypothetical protein
MMVNCPRCGFSQPQDQYCAQCGIDMVAFKPAQKPFYEKLISNTYFQVAILFVVVGTVFFVARENRRRELAERIAEIENAGNTQILSKRSIAASSTGKSELASATHDNSAGNQAGSATHDNSKASAPAAAMGSRSTVETPVSQPASLVAPDENKPALGTAPNGNRTATNISVTFAEVTRAHIADLISAAEPQSGTLQGPILTGVIQSFATKIKPIQTPGQYDVLDSSSHSIKATQPVEIFGGQRDETSGLFIGFAVETIASHLDENESHLQIKVWRYLRDSNGQGEEFSVPLPDSFSVPSGGGVFIAGSQLLPHRTNLSDADRRFYDPIKIIRLITTEEFRQGLAELVIFIEPK